MAVDWLRDSGDCDGRRPEAESVLCVANQPGMGLIHLSLYDARKSSGYDREYIAILRGCHSGCVLEMGAMAKLIERKERHTLRCARNLLRSAKRRCNGSLECPPCCAAAATHEGEGGKWRGGEKLVVGGAKYLCVRRVAVTAPAKTEQMNWL